MKRLMCFVVVVMVGMFAGVARADIPSTERDVLVALYNSAGGEGWAVQTNWNGAPGTECTWYGVTCDSGTSAHVIRIYLSKNNLQGTIPPLTGLTALQSFDVHNDIYGSYQNQLTGTIPDLTGLTALSYFDVSFNKLTGTIPSLTGLTALSYFNLFFNKLTGTIPDLSGLTALQRFDVSSNQLTGTIPSLTGMTALQSFNVSGNGLTGTIPSLTGLSAVHFGFFDVSLNQLTGPIPELTGLTLGQFNVSQNQLTGPIPSLTGLSALGSFDVSHNQLTGSIPSLTGLTRLNDFNVSSNQLTGTIPALTGLSGLNDFNVSSNQLTGTIPALTGLSGLNYFTVSQNQLTGAIPDPPQPWPGVVLASLCPNYLTPSTNPQTNTAWDRFSNVTPWNKLCLPNSPFTISNFGGTSLTTNGSGALTVGYARILASPGSTTPTGVAIFGLRQNGVLITETGVPSVPLIWNGRIYAEVGGAVETGLAIANPGRSSAIVTFHFTDVAGADFGSGSTTVEAGTSVGVFLDQTPFNGGAAIQGTFSFSSSVPIGVTALRGFTNERSEFLLTTLPVVDTSFATGTSPLSLSQFADGGGWRTQVILVNPTDYPLTGTIQFLGDGTATVAAPPVTLTANGQAASSFAYTVPRQSSFKLATSGAPSTTSSGSVRVTPTGNTVAPSALLVFSYKPGAVTVSEAGVPAIQGNAFRMYAEVNNVAMPGPIETGVAVAKLGSTPGTVTFELFKLDGSAAGVPSTSLPLPANGHLARFVQELFPTLTLPFQGILRISSGAASGISVVGLRGRYNERHDFLITTTPPSNEAAPTSSLEQVFPRLVNGGGYTTQFILFSGTAGQVSSGNLDYLDEAGLGLRLPLN